MSNKQGQKRLLRKRINLSSSLSCSKSSCAITPPIFPYFNSIPPKLNSSSLMKRSSTSASDQITDRKMKKIRLEEDEESSSVEDNTEFEKVLDRKMKEIQESSLVEDKIQSVMLDENLLYEVLKHADARTLGASACVNKQWHKTSQDERLWELICTKQWANIGCGNQQLRSVVLALGGFRRLHALYLWPLAKPAVPIAAPQATTSAWPCLPLPVKSGPAKKRWGKDEVHLSLSLLSIRYYEKMNFSGRGK